MFAHRLAWVIRTAFGVAVEPDVSCNSAVSDSSASAPAVCAGSARSRSAMLTTPTPPAARAAAAPSNGGPTITNPAWITLSTDAVSRAKLPMSVRAVGWCSIVTDPPASHTACAAGAMSAGAAASTATAEPARTPLSARTEAIVSARLRIARHGVLIGVCGSPVIMPVPVVAASASASVNRLMREMYRPGQLLPGISASQVSATCGPPGPRPSAPGDGDPHRSAKLLPAIPIRNGHSLHMGFTRI